MLYSAKIFLRVCFISKIFDFLPFSMLKLHFQNLTFAKIQYNEILYIIIGFLQPYEQKFVDIMMLYSAKIFLKDVHRKIFYFLPFSMLKLHFQHLTFAKIQYNVILSLIIEFLQPYEQKLPVDIMMLLFCKNIFERMFHP